MMPKTTWRLLSIPRSTHEQGWWPTPRWALRALGAYAAAALSGGLLFVFCAALYFLFSTGSTHAAPTFDIFGYVDLGKIVTAAVGVLVLAYALFVRHKLVPVLLSSAVPVFIFFSFVGAQYVTAETIKTPRLLIRTNAIDTTLCNALTLIRCRFPSINCKQFTLLPGGMWQSSGDATLVYPYRLGSFGNNIFSVHAIIINGIDIGLYLYETCG